jgi:type I restriction enzyme S subunit
MITNIQKYPVYKDSGVEWLQNIPENWEILPSKRFHQVKKQPNSKRLCDNVLSLTLRGVVNNDPDSPEGMVPKDYGTYQIFETENLVFKLIDLENVKTSRVGIVHEKGIMSSAYIRLVIGQDNFAKFTYYYFYSLYINQVYNNLGSGVRSTLGPTDLLNIPYLKPSLSEQTAIAAFLDCKTTLIDQAIDIKQKQIELLKERRQILIHKAVTRGLNPNVKMKDSGLEWITKIPEGWEVMKLRYLANSFPSNIDKHSKPNEKEVRLCNYTDVYKNDYITDDMELMIATASAEQITKFTLKEGDIVITKDSETASDIAVPTYIREKLTNVVCGYHLAVIRTYQESYSKYLFHALKTKLFNAQFEVCSNGITRVGLGNSDLKNGYFLLPPKQEQIEIAEFIEKGISKIATAIALKEQEIEKLKEYKTTLVNSAVTGKIKLS